MINKLFSNCVFKVSLKKSRNSIYNTIKFIHISVINIQNNLLGFFFVNIGQLPEPESPKLDTDSVRKVHWLDAKEWDVKKS